MIIAPLLLALAAQTTPPPAAATPPSPPPAPAAPPAPKTPAERFDQCIEFATSADPHMGEAAAAAWERGDGKYFARQCRGVALANEGKWEAAAQEFEAAANEAEVAHDTRASRYWSQAGNAWLAAGNAAKAQSALDAALASGTLESIERGEATFDHARALVELGNLAPARTDMDAALALVKNDPLIWLSSAALARKMKDIPRAKQDIIQAYKLSPDDASIYLEIGNIAAAGGDVEGARSAWSDAARIGKDTPVGQNASIALKQLDAR